MGELRARSAIVEGENSEELKSNRRPIKHDKNQAKETIPAQEHYHPLQVTTQPREELVSVSTSA